MRLRTLLLSACLAAMPLAAAADDVPEPNGVDMGPSPTVGDPPPTTEHADGDTSALGDAAATAADPNDEADQNVVGSTFDGSALHDGDPTEPGGTHVEPNGDP